MALAKGAPFLFHSDQGSQYAAWAHTERLLERGIQITMADKGIPTQNGLAEQFILTVREKHVDHADYADFEDAYRQVQNWLEVTYMTERVHQSLNYVTSAEFEVALLAQSCSPTLTSC